MAYDLGESIGLTCWSFIGSDRSLSLRMNCYHSFIPDRYQPVLRGFETLSIAVTHGMGTVLYDDLRELYADSPFE